MKDVSVCIPCYNEGRYLDAAVRSVVRQTAFDRIREIIVVDDGSTDNTRERIQGLRDEGIALTYIATSNAGPSAARNRALKEASGEFVAFLDGDDLWSSEKTERQLPEFEDPEVGLVYCDYIDFEDVSLDDGMLVCVRRLDKHGQALVADYFLNDGPIFPSAAILRRNVYYRIGGFDERFRMAEDTDYWLRMALAGYRFRHVPGGLLCKRRHQANLTHDLERWLGVFKEQTSAYAAIHTFLAPLAKRRLSQRYARIGQSFLAKRRILRALTYLRKALQLDPGNARAWSYIVALPLYAAGGAQGVGEIKRAYHLMRSRTRGEDARTRGQDA
jgi:glycosyltransferase involved in cell wall biosynthesis